MSAKRSDYISWDEYFMGVPVGDAVQGSEYPGGSLHCQPGQ